MKIALCLSGYLRTFEENFKNLQDNLLSLYDQVDIFIATWSYSDERILSDKDKQTVQKLLNPREILIQESFTIPATPFISQRNIEPIRVTNNVLSMFYSIKRANELKSAYERQNNFFYDCVIRSRPDIKLLEPLKITSSPDKLYIPKWGDFFGLNDQFAYSNSKIMDVYSDMFDHIEETLKSDTRLYLKPELLLKKYLENNRILIERPSLNYEIIRSDGTILNNEKRDIIWNQSPHLPWEVF